MNIQGVFQFMSSEQGNSFFCDVTPENSTEFLEQLMQNEEFTTLAREYVADETILRQKIVIKIGQMCKKMKKPKDETVPLPVTTANVVETSLPKLVDGYANRNGSNAGISVSYSEGLRRSPEEYELDESSYACKTEEDRRDADNVVVTLSPSELGIHIGQGIYLQKEGHVFKMTTPKFVVYY